MNDDNLGEETLAALRKHIAHAEALETNEAIDYLEAAFKIMKTMPDRIPATDLVRRALRVMKEYV